MNTLENIEVNILENVLQFLMKLRNIIRGDKNQYIAR